MDSILTQIFLILMAREPTKSESSTERGLLQCDEVWHDWPVATLAPTNFGPLIAYVIPGSGLLYCLRSVSEDIDKWFGTLNSDAPTIAGFLFVTLAAVAAGLLLSTVRWLVLDTLHHTTGIEKPQLEMQKLASATEAFRLIVEHKYKYYQFYGNSLIALLLGSPVVAVENGCSVKSAGLRRL